MNYLILLVIILFSFSCKKNFFSKSEVNEETLIQVDQEKPKKRVRVFESELIKNDVNFNLKKNENVNKASNNFNPTKDDVNIKNPSPISSEQDVNIAATAFLQQNVKNDQQQNITEKQNGVENKAIEVKKEVVTNDKTKDLKPLENNAILNNVNASKTNSTTNTNAKVSEINKNISQTEYYIQVGAFSTKEACDKIIAKLTKEDIKCKTETNNNAFKVLVGPYLSRDEAVKTKDNQLKKIDLSGFIVIKK